MHVLPAAHNILHFQIYTASLPDLFRQSQQSHPVCNPQRQIYLAHGKSVPD